MVETDGIHPVRKRRYIPNLAFPYMLIFPSMLLVLLIMVYPVFDVFFLSFQHYNLNNIFLKGFAGFGNFKELFADGMFYESLGITVKWVLLEIAFQLVFGMIMALLLNAKLPGRGVSRSLSLVPWAVSGVLTTMLWTLMYDQNIGLINTVLVRLGILHTNIAWLSDSHTFFGSIVLAELWRGIPFFAITLLAALQSIPQDIYESCAMDGCGPVRTYFYITLPFLKESIIFATLLRAIWEFNSIDMIFTMTNGGPMNQTTTLPIYMMKTAVIQGNYGYGSAIGVVSFFILLVFALVYIKMSGFGGDTDEN